MDTVHQVSMGAFLVGGPGDVLETGGIGSCVALCLYHPVTKVGALAHIMLPSNIAATANDYRYCNAAIPAMVTQLAQMGVPPGQLIAKMAGGANMFPGVQGPAATVGERNVQAIKELAKQYGIRLSKEDTGGAVGRAVVFDLGSGVVTVTTTL